MPKQSLVAAGALLLLAGCGSPGASADVMDVAPVPTTTSSTAAASPPVTSTADAQDPAPHSPDEPSPPTDAAAALATTAVVSCSHSGSLLFKAGVQLTNTTDTPHSYVVEVDVSDKSGDVVARTRGTVQIVAAGKTVTVSTIAPSSTALQSQGLSCRVVRVTSG